MNTLNYKNKRVIISISVDKDKKSMIELLDNTFNELVFTKYTYKRSATSSELYELSNSINKKIIQDNLRYKQKQAEYEANQKKWSDD